VIVIGNQSKMSKVRKRTKESKDDNGGRNNVQKKLGLRGRTRGGGGGGRRG
jgi:hypothetical protein